MRIGFITQWYDPEQGSALVPGALARGLSSKGFEIEVLTGFPNFPHGRIFSDYRQRPLSREVRDGITVYRVPLLPDHSERPLRRGACYASFALTSTGLGLPALGRVDAHLVYGSPVMSGVSLALTRRVRSTPLVTYVSDLWPDSVLASGLAPTGRFGASVSKSVSAMANVVYSRSDALIATTASMCDELLARYPSTPRVTLVYNWIDERRFPVAEVDHEWRSRLAPNGEVIAMYAGSLGYAQDPMVWLRVALRQPTIDGLVFAFVGSGPLLNEMQTRVEAAGLRNIHFFGQRSVEESARLIASSDVQLISLRESRLLDVTLPSKVQASMASGKPIIAAAGGETARIIATSGCGQAHPIADEDALHQALREIVEIGSCGRTAVGQAGRDYYSAFMSSAVGLKKMSKLLLEL